MPAPPPTVQAIVLCRHVFTDRDTGPFVLAGTLRRFTAREMPAELPRCDLWLSLTEVRDRGDVRVSFAELQTEDPGVECGRYEVIAGDPLEPVELAVPLLAQVIGHFGTHAVELHWVASAELLASWRIRIDRDLGGEA